MILLIRNHEGGLWHHRMLIPFLDLLNKGMKVVSAPGFHPDMDLSETKIVVFQRIISLKGKTKEYIDFLHSKGIKVIFEIDDYWNLPESHSEYIKYRVMQVSKYTIEAIKYSDVVFTTTTRLASYVKKFNKNVHIVPNCLDLREKQWQSTKIEHSLVRFAYICGVHHKEDSTILQAPTTLMHEKLDCQILLGGYNTNSAGHYQFIEEKLTDNYRALDADYVTYLKENTKLQEHYSMFQKYRRLWAQPVNSYGTMYDHVDVDPYKNIPGVLYADKPIEFYHHAKKLMDKNYRDDMANILHEHILLNFDLQKVNQIRQQVCEKLVSE